MKTAYDMAHVKSVTAVALTFNGEFAGRIVANWSDNPMGSVCTVTVGIWDGPLKAMPKKTGRAGGYGYDKLASALERLFGDGCPGGGRSSVWQWLESKGYVVVEVI